MKLSTLQRAIYVKTVSAGIEANLRNDGEELGYRTADSLGGPSKVTLRRIAWEQAERRCSHCRQSTRFDVAADAPDAATIGLLIPSSMSTVRRAGYVSFNTASFCRTCINLTNGTYADGSVWVWVATSFDCESTLTVWPSLPKSKSPAKFASTVDPIAWRRECLRVFAARGLTLPPQD